MNMLRNEYASSSSLLPQAPSVTASVPSRYMRKPTLVRSHGIFVFVTAAGSSTAYGGAPSRREPSIVPLFLDRHSIFGVVVAALASTAYGGASRRASVTLGL